MTIVLIQVPYYNSWPLKTQAVSAGDRSFGALKDKLLPRYCVVCHKFEHCRKSILGTSKILMIVPKELNNNS